MPSRNSNMPTELPRPSLTISKVEANEKLSERIELGKELQGRSFNSENDLVQARSDLKEWHDYNKELLGVLFSNEKFAAEYTNQSHGPMVMANHIGQEIENYYNSIGAKLTALSSITKRLDLISEQASASTLAGYDGLPPHQPTQRSSGHTTVNVSGGTMILGDGAKINNVTVGDIITSLEQEINKLPDSDEKAQALGGLRTILSNETFANVTGAVVGSFLAHLLR